MTNSDLEATVSSSGKNPCVEIKARSSPPNGKNTRRLKKPQPMVARRRTQLSACLTVLVVFFNGKLCAYIHTVPGVQCWRIKRYVNGRQSDITSNQYVFIQTLNVSSVCHRLMAGITMGKLGNPNWMPHFVEFGRACSASKMVRIEMLPQYSIQLLYATRAYLAPFGAVHFCHKRTE